MAPEETSNVLDAGVPLAPREVPGSKSLQSEEEYIWRFDLKGRANGGIGYKDPLVEMVRLLLADFLNIGVLTCNGEPVQVTGFAFNNKPEDIFDIFLPEGSSSGTQHEKL